MGPSSVQRHARSSRGPALFTLCLEGLDTMSALFIDPFRIPHAGHSLRSGGSSDPYFFSCSAGFARQRQSVIAEPLAPAKRSLHLALTQVGTKLFPTTPGLLSVVAGLSTRALFFSNCAGLTDQLYLAKRGTRLSLLQQKLIHNPAKPGVRLSSPHGLK
jgi:hypothetical protein